jgi:hypothetical protein
MIKSLESLILIWNTKMTKRLQHGAASERHFPISATNEETIIIDLDQLHDNWIR